MEPSVKGTVGYMGCRICMFNGRTCEYPPKGMIASASERLIENDVFGARSKRS